MRNSALRFSAGVRFDEETIQKVFRVEYFTYSRLKVVVWAGIGLAMILSAVFLELSIVATGLLLAVGFFMVMGMDFPSRVMADGLIEARRGAVTEVSLKFYEDRVSVVEAGRTYSYPEVDRLVEEGDFMFLFFSRQDALVLHKKTLQPANTPAFRKFISERSGKKWKMTALWMMNFWDVIDAIKDQLGLRKKKKSSFPTKKQLNDLSKKK